MEEFRRGASNRRSDLYPQFPEGEFERRWRAVRELMDDEDLDALVIHGDKGFHQPFVRYLTNYNPPFTTYLVAFADPDEDPALFIGLSNHLQYVREVSTVDDVRLSVHDPGGKVADRLAASVEGGRVGLVGLDPRYEAGMPYRHHEELSSRLEAELTDATAPFTKLVSVRSDVEIERIRRAGEALDKGMEAIVEEAETGMSEADLRSVLSEAVGHEDGGPGVVFLSVAPMEGAEPGEPLPWKATPADRELSAGDVITTEVSAHHRDYASQIHRPFAVGQPPTDIYQEIFDIAQESYERMIDALRPGNTPADVHDALAPVENSRFKSYDVSLHGYGGGYLHPFVGTERSNYWPGADDPLTADWTFKPGQVLVVQPNVLTEDERHGLQLGTTVLVTRDGPENVHEYPVEFGQV